MLKIKVILLLFSALLLIPLASNSEATFWDLQIHASVDNAPIVSGERAVVSGVVLDHASKPVGKAEINIRSETMSIFTTTSQSGEFLADLGKHERVPGIYLVNISATDVNGNTGITSIQFQVKGEISLTAENQERLSTPQAKKYLESNPEDFEKDPLGLMLYNYYQKIHQDYLKNQENAKQIAEEKKLKEQEREIANQNRLDAIKEFNPSYGIFSGPEYEKYVDSLDEGVRDTVVAHLNFTKNLFIEAQNLRATILENGGTAEEAQAAYLEKLTVTRDTIENFPVSPSNEQESVDENMDELANKISNGTRLQPWPSSYQELTSNSTIAPGAAWPSSYQELNQQPPIQVNVDGVEVEVAYIESIFSVNINGTVLEFLVNGTEIIQVENIK